MFVCSLGAVHRSLSACVVVRGQSAEIGSLFTMWVLWVQLNLSGSVARDFTCWAISLTKGGDVGEFSKVTDFTL